MGRQRIAAASIALLTVLAAGAHAVPALPAQAAPLSTAAQLLAAGHYGDGFRALARAQGLALPAAPAFADAAAALVELSHGTLDRAGAIGVLAKVPAHLQAPVATLLIGEAQADALVQGQLAKHPGATVADALAHAQPWNGIARNAPAQPATKLQLPSQDGWDQGAFDQGEASLLDAIQAALPALTQPTTQGVGDVLDERPYLIISGTGADTYNPGDDAILIIDEGGNDVYNNAQGAPFAGLGFAEVIVDAAGNDQYVKSATLATPGTLTLTAQGAADLGVGGIVDAAGDDTYSASASYAAGTGNDEQSIVMAQGAGVLGVGALLDLGGNDCVSASATGHGDTASIVAQGAGDLGAGFAALLGTPAAACPQTSAVAVSDPLIISNTGSSLVEQIGLAQVAAQGGALLGAGALVGGLANNAYVASGNGGLATTAAQGGADVGAGALVDLGGSDSYTARATSSVTLHQDLSGSFSSVGVSDTIHLGDTLAIAQGGANGGAGVLLDAGPADNTYLVDASMSADAYSRAVTTFASGTTSADANVTVGKTAAIAQGAGELGAGLLLGAGTPTLVGSANDARTVRSTVSAHSTAIAGGGVSNVATAFTSTGNAAAHGQGWGATGAGVLADEGGNDAYALQATVNAGASATVNGATVPSTLLAGTADAAGQGKALTGLGALIDVFGVDSYSTSPGANAAGNDQCWTNSPPGLPNDANVGIGVDALSGGVPANCIPPPN